MNIVFEKLETKHRKVVMDIFNYYVENSFAAFAECRLSDIFFEEIREKTRNYPAYVIKDTDTGTVTGFCYLSAYRTLTTFKRTAKISYFILPHYTHAGVGKMSLDRLESDARKQGIGVILAEISSGNPPSIAFHGKNGFERCGCLKHIGYKHGEYFDVIIMQKELVKS